MGAAPPRRHRGSQGSLTVLKLSEPPHNLTMKPEPRPPIYTGFRTPPYPPPVTGSTDRPNLRSPCSA